MDLALWLYIIAAIALLGISGLMNAADAAFTSVPQQKVRIGAEDGKRGYSSVAAIMADLPTHINVLQFVTAVTEAGSTVFITMFFISFMEVSWQAVVLSIVVAAVLVFVLAGVSPRTIGRRRALEVSLWSAWLVHGLRTALGPVARVLVFLGNLLTPARVYRDGPFVTEDQLRDLVERASASDIIEDDEREMIQSVFNLTDTSVRKVMVPRTDLVAVDADTVLHKSMTLFLRSGFSRVPVVGKDEDDVIGVLYLKDVARRLHQSPGDGQSVTAGQLARDVTFVPETKPAAELLRQMQLESIHVAIAVDEYGGTAGLVTIEDIVEEIVGEIDDEYDSNDDEIEKQGDGHYRISTRAHLEDIAEELGVRLEDEDVTSIGGLLAKAIGKVPIAGSTATVAGLEITALPGIGRRHTISYLDVRVRSDERTEDEE